MKCKYILLIISILCLYSCAISDSFYYVFGQVLDENGVPIADSSVEYMGSKKTDSSGCFEFDILYSFGKNTFRVTSPGYKTYSVVITTGAHYVEVELVDIDVEKKESKGRWSTLSSTKSVCGHNV